jgi:hypothetical protein
MACSIQRLAAAFLKGVNQVVLYSREKGGIYDVRFYDFSFSMRASPLQTALVSCF